MCVVVLSLVSLVSFGVDTSLLMPPNLFWLQFGSNKQNQKYPVLLSVGLAQMDLIDGDVKGAVERFNEALTRAPDNKELVLVLGALHKKYKKLLSTSTKGGRKIDKALYAQNSVKGTFLCGSVTRVEPVL